MLADWYSPSHIVHGFLFYAALRLAVPALAVERRFLVALLIEAAWEMLENTPLVIDRYREATIALGYIGRQHPQLGQRHRDDGAGLPRRAAPAGVGQRRDRRWCSSSSRCSSSATI